MKVKEESEKVALKLNIQKTKIMASGPITSWQIDGETVTNFIFGGSKIIANGDCSHEIQRCLLLGRKAMTNLDSMLKSSHYFADKGPSSQNYGFSSSHVGEGNGNQLQYSCLENPGDKGAWWAAIYGVAQSQTRLKRLSGSSRN